MESQIKNAARRSLGVAIEMLRGKLQRPLSLSKFEDIIRTDLRLRAGDSVMVHSNFSRLNADFSPREAVICLMDTVTSRGNILMPFYPYGSGYDWLRSDRVFDLNRTRPATGFLPLFMSDFPGARKSVHPIKAVVAWGKDRDFLIADHHRSETPYDQRSPYCRLMQFDGSKSIGMGILSNSCFHACEDIAGMRELYAPKTMEGRCIDYNGEQIKVRTYVHDPRIVAAGSREFLKVTGCPSYAEFRINWCSYYYVRLAEMRDHYLKMARQGITLLSLKYTLS